MVNGLLKPGEGIQGALDEAGFERQKWEDFRKPTVLMSLVCALLVMALWSWDWVIDPVRAPETFGLRLLLSLSILIYPLALLTPARRIAPAIFYAMLLWLEVVFLWILGKLSGGAVHGVAGFMYWFIVPPLLSFILPLRTNILGNAGVIVFPNLLVGGLGVLPEFDLAKFNALIIPAGLTTIVGHYMIDRLLRRVYEYRTQLAWRAKAMDVLAEGVVVLQEGRVRYINAAAARIIDAEPEQVVGRMLRELVSVPEEPVAPGGVTCLTTPEGRSVWVKVSSSDTHWLGRPAKLVAVADVTEQHLTEEAQHQSEQRYRQVVDNVTEGILVVQDGRFVFVNEAMKRITGYTTEQILGRSNLDFVVPEQREMVRDRYERRMKGEPLSPRFDFQIVVADGARMWARLSGVMIEWGGRPAMLYFFSDIDAQHRAEQALQQSEERYREVVDNVNEGITVVQGMRFVFCNPCMAQLSGYTLGEIYAMDSIYDLADPSAWPTLKERAKRREMGEPVEPRFEFCIRCKDGTRKWVELSVVVISWRGAPATLSFVIDTTHRHKMEQALRQSEERYRNVINNMSEGLMVVQDKRIVFCNPSAAALSGYSQEDLYRWESVDRLAFSEDQPGLAERYRRRMSGETVEDRYEFRLRRKDGSIRRMEMSVVVIEWEGRPATLGFMFDSTERHQIQEALRRSEANYRRVIESSPVGIAVVHANRAMMANRALCQIVESSEEEILARGSFLERVHPEDLARMKAYALERPTIKGEQAGSTSFRLCLSPGRTIWVEGSTVQVEWQGKPATLSFLQDVTERKRLEENLKRSLAERETILERSIVGIALLDAQGRLLWANQAMGQIFGRGLHSAAGASLEPYYPTREAYLATGAAVSAAVKRGEPFETELQMRREDGGLFWAHLSGKAVNSSDLSQGTVWAVMDIDHRKRLEEELQRTSSEREVILQSTLVGIIYSRERHHVWVNRAFADMVGYTPEELIGQSSRLHFPSDESYREFGERGYSVMATGAPWSTEWELMRRDGSKLWTQILGRSLDPAHPQAGSIWTLVDITARKKAEAEVRAALEKQRELNELKSRFVSMTSHEFRTPLATILSSAELMKYYGERLPESERAELLVNIEKAVGRMTGMLNDVLLLGRADAGRLDFKPVPLNLGDFCRGLADEVARAEAAEGRASDRVRLRIPEPALRANLDEKLMRHILGNLLLNAHKYAPGDTPIELLVEEAEGGLLFVVADRGIGIPEDDLPHLFESFHRARNVGNIQGTGLGLAIVKKAVDRHGGRVEVSSRVGEGTQFSVFIPRI